MNLYLAPMEEITGYNFRNVLSRHFGGVDKYITPFVTPNQNKILKTRDGREINPEHNKGLNVVPQVLTNNAEHFNELAELLADLGYREINLNLGCPSNTVVKKYKGSGIFRDTDILERLLDGIFSHNQKTDISVKTRLGMEDDQEFEDILRIYNRYPISELTIHPRVQKDFYKGAIRINAFENALFQAGMRVCYNGNIFAVSDYENVKNKYEEKISAVMIGRGAVYNPGIFREIRTGKSMTKDELSDFLADLYETYATEYSEVDGLFKLKEVWCYTKDHFRDIDKPLKKLRKSGTKAEYQAAVNEIFMAECDLGN